MKNSVIAFTSLILLLSADSGKALAQRDKYVLLTNLRTNRSGTFIDKPDEGQGYARALKSFSRLYKNISNETWVKVKDGFVARFLSYGIRYSVLYNTKGYWTGLVKNYTEEKLPRNIREIVKSKYYDYSIFYVDEMETSATGDAPVYIVHLEDKVGVKLVRVYNGDMDVWMEYVKG